MAKTMAQTERTIFNLSHELIVGWPTTFNMSGTADEYMVATEFYMNTPAAGFIEIQKFSTIRNAESVEFCGLAWPYPRIASLPGPPIDPHTWTQLGHLKARVTPLCLGPSEAHGDIHDLRMRIRHNGLVPPGMKGGERFKLVAFFMQVR